jgi:GT2 family glycosyltransferase
VYVVILNWNGWRDTIACLDSVLRSSHPSFQVVVCDNASADDSVERLLAWASGAEATPPPRPGDPLGRLLTPPLPKPITHVVLDREAAERGGDARCAGARLVVVRTGANLGFAGGCNVGLRYALARGDCDHAWLLNNDTVVEPDALAALVQRLAERPDAGQCGSRVLYHDAPDRVQCWGGARYGPALATVRCLGDGQPAHVAPAVASVEREITFVFAASALVRREYLDAVGLMAEDYFLYFEELDWAMRGRAFAKAYAHGSIVYHREGQSTGSSRDGRERSELADYYSLRNRLLVTRRFFPRALPTVYCALVGALLNRLLRRQFRRAAMVLGILAGRRAVPPALAPTGHPSPDRLAHLARR